MAGRGVACGRKPGRCAVTGERRLDLAVRVVVAPLHAVRTGSSGSRQRRRTELGPGRSPFFVPEVLVPEVDFSKY
jgi:hypothetical protein